jgi:hypothetical protein
LYANKIEGRVRLSCGSVESHTAQWHPSVGTPMDVPEPSTVNWREGMGWWDVAKSFLDSSGDVGGRATPHHPPK